MDRKPVAGFHHLKSRTPHLPLDKSRFLNHTSLRVSNQTKLISSISQHSFGLQGYGSKRDICPNDADILENEKREERTC